MQLTRLNAQPPALFICHLEPANGAVLDVPREVGSSWALPPSRPAAARPSSPAAKRAHRPPPARPRHGPSRLCSCTAASLPPGSLTSAAPTAHLRRTTRSRRHSPATRPRQPDVAGGEGRPLSMRLPSRAACGPMTPTKGRREHLSKPVWSAGCHDTHPRSEGYAPRGWHAVSYWIHHTA